MAKKSKKKKKRSMKKPAPVHSDNLQDMDRQTNEQDVHGDSVDDQYDRIFKTLGVDDEDGADVEYENLETFRLFINKEISFPIIVTGMEDMGCFGWEEFYILGPGSKKEYEKLKKKRPSFKDKYNLLSLEEEFDEDEGLYANVQRISDKKKFTLTLADLKAVEKKTSHARILDDYAAWHTNFR